MNLNKKVVIGTANFDLNYKLLKNNNINRRKIYSILNYCKQNKFEYFDTAQSYEFAEEILGNYSKENQCNFKVITKVKESEIVSEKNLSKSIKRLYTKPFCLLCHDYKQYLNKKNINKLLELKEKKQIKYFGVSVYNKKEIEQVIKFQKPDILQIPINILDQRLVKDNYLKEIKKKNIEIHARSIFLRGLLFYDYLEISKIFPSIKSEILKLHNNAKFENLSLSQLSLAWVNSIKEIDKLVIGITSDIELKENLEILSKKIINDNARTEFDININDDMILNPSKWKKQF